MMSNNIKRILLNTCVIAGIVFLSTLSIDYPPRIENIWAAFIGASLSFLTQLKTISDSKYKDDEEQPPLGMLL